MKRSGLLWMVGAAFLGTMAYALAEELILTTYYPSPRGVYQELRVGSGSVSTPTGKLHVVQADPSVLAPPAFRVDDQTPPDPTPFVIDREGNVSAPARVDIGMPSGGFPAPAMLVIRQATPNQASFGLTKSGGPGWSLIAVPNVGTDGGYNPVSKLGDVGLFFNDGELKDTGNLAIGPWSDTATGMRITKEGKVGIGTPAPASRLTVVDNTGEAIWGATTGGTGIRATATSGTALTAAATTGNAVTAAVTSPAPATAIWGSASGGGNAGLFQGLVRVEGNLLVSAGGALHLEPTSTPPGANGKMYYDSSSNKFRCYENGAWKDCGGSSFWAASGSHIYNTNSGNVGIGGTPPAGSKLYVTSTAGTYGIQVTQTGSGTFGISSWGEHTGLYGSGDTNGVYGSTGSGVGVRGRSAVGTGVVGDGSTCDFDAVGGGTNYCAPSSLRWKTNIQPIEQAIEKVVALRGVYFDWDKDHGGRHDVGMIGEEVGAVLPEVVVWEPDGVYTSGMDYSKLTPLLLEAIKEQQAELDALKAELAILKTQLANRTK